MGKTYVVFVGRKPGVYETWEEAQKEVNKFSGASHMSFWSREEALKAFDTYMKKQVPPSTSSASASESRNSIQAEKLVKMEEALSNLANENSRHASSVAEIMEDLKQKMKSLEISGGD